MYLVPKASYGLNKFDIKILIYLDSKHLNMSAYDITPELTLIVPDTIFYITLREDTSCMSHEDLEYLKVYPGQIDLSASPEGGLRLHIELEIPDSESRSLCVSKCRPTSERLDPRDEFSE